MAKKYFLKTKALEQWNDNLVVGLLGPNAGDAKVYLFDGDDWRLIGSPENVEAWRNLNYVQVLRQHEGQLYAGINSEVWVYSAETQQWHPTVATDGGTPWGQGAAYCMRTHNGDLYLGVMDTSPRAYKLQGEEWIDVSSGLPNDGFHGIYELWSHTDGYLYASLAADKGSTAIYRLEDEGKIWSKIGGQGVNGSWIGEGFRYGLSLTSHDGWLLLSANRHPQTAGKFSSVWAFKDGAWQPVGASNAPEKWGALNNFNAIV